MAKTKADKRKAKRKIKLKAKRQSAVAAVRSEKADFFYYESGWFRESDDYEKALIHLKKALKMDPDNKLFLVEMVHLGYDMDSSEVQLSGLSRLYDNGQMDDEYLPPFLDLLARNRQYQQALEVSEILLPRLTGMKIENKRKVRTTTIQIQKYCRYQLELEQTKNDARKKSAIRTSSPKNKTPRHPSIRPPSQEQKENKKPVPKISVVISVDDASFQTPLSSGRFMSYEQYELALEGHGIRFRTPAVKILYQTSFGRKQKQLSMIYNPVTKSMDPLVCDGCGDSTFNIRFCDHFHILCPACSTKCPAC